MKYLLLVLLALLSLFLISCREKGVLHLKNDKDERYICNQYYGEAEIGDIIYLDTHYRVVGFTEGEWFNYQLRGGYRERALPIYVDSFSIIEWSIVKQDSIEVTYKFTGTCK